MALFSLGLAFATFAVFGIVLADLFSLSLAFVTSAVFGGVAFLVLLLNTFSAHFFTLGRGFDELCLGLESGDVTGNAGNRLERRR